MIERRAIGIQGPGLREVPFDGSGRSAGVYPYRLLLEDPATGARRGTFSGKVVLLK